MVVDVVVIMECVAQLGRGRRRGRGGGPDVLDDGCILPGMKSYIMGRNGLDAPSPQRIGRLGF